MKCVRDVTPENLKATLLLLEDLAEVFSMARIDPDDIVYRYTKKMDFYESMVDQVCSSLYMDNDDIADLIAAHVEECGCRSPAVVDIGCFDGKTFTATVAGKVPGSTVHGLDRFDPELMNRDITINRTYGSAEEARAHSESKHGLSNIRMHIMDLGLSSGEIRDCRRMIYQMVAENDNLIVTALKVPSPLQYVVSEIATGLEADLLVTAPSNLGSMDKDSKFFPPVFYRLRNSDMRKERLAETLGIRYSMMAQSGQNVPITFRDGILHDVNYLAKQFAVEDMGCAVADKGYDVSLANYHRYGWGNDVAEHVLIARNQRTPIIKNVCPSGRCNL